MALIVALVMLVVIGFASVSVMRGAMSTDLVANNSRVQAMANQAAQIALAFCERELRIAIEAGTAVPKLHVVAATEPSFFNNINNWTDANLNVIPDDWMNSGNSTAVPRTPECMIEQLNNTAAGYRDFAVTARGFSPDYSADPDTGATESGSVVWLQSRLLYQ